MTTERFLPGSDITNMEFAPEITHEDTLNALLAHFERPGIQVVRQEIPGIGTGAPYASGDAFGLGFTIPFPSEGIITNVLFIDLDNEGINKELVLFRGPFAQTSDNAVFAPSAAALLNSAGPPVVIDTFYSYSANKIGTGTPALWIQAPQRRLYAQMVTRGADNIAAGSIPLLIMTIGVVSP